MLLDGIVLLNKGCASLPPSQQDWALESLYQNKRIYYDGVRMV